MVALNEVKNIPAHVAAKILGVSVSFVYIGLQRGLLPIGTAVKTSSHWTYHISYKLLSEYAGEDKIKLYEQANCD